MLLCLILVVAGPFAFDTYMVNTLIKAFFFAVAAITVDLLWGYTGYLTFGQSAFFGAGAYCAGLVFTHLGFSSEYALLAGVLSVVIPGLLALFVGWLSFYHGAAPFFSCVISLVVPIVVYQLVLSGGNFTGSSSGLTGFETFDFEIESWYWIAGAIMLVAAIAADIFVKSDAGKILVAIRDNEQRCEYLGLNTYVIKTLLLGVCGALAGFAGFSFTTRISARGAPPVKLAAGSSLPQAILAKAVPCPCSSLWATSSPGFCDRSALLICSLVYSTP